MLGKIFMISLLVCSHALNAVAQEKAQGIAMIETEFSQEDLEEMMTSADLETIDKLHEQGFDFNTKDVLGNPALYYLLTKNTDLEIARRAIDYGADVNAPAGNGMIPLNITTSKANEMQLQIMMMKTLGLDVTREDVQNALKENLFLEMNRMIEMAKMLIEKGADVNQVSSLGSPLTNAVTNAWNLEIADLLLKAGADPNWQDKEGRTALFYAAAGGNEDIITLLLKAGADPEIKDKDGKVYLDVEKIKVESVL